MSDHLIWRFSFGGHSRHIEAPSLATLVTTRNSGSSYLNRVELQNGCLACTYANLFIPSNLSGLCFSPETGKVDMNLLKSNMDSATDVYISRVNQAPCGGSVIHLFKGASWHQKIRDCLSIFLKGTNQEGKLMIDHPDEYQYINKVWTIRAHYLRCCFKQGCHHPFCCNQPQNIVTMWFLNGPPLSYLPFPVPDPNNPWGGHCDQCKGECCGHFLKPQPALESTIPAMMVPPSSQIKDAFDRQPSTWKLIGHEW